MLGLLKEQHGGPGTGPGLSDRLQKSLPGSSNSHIIVVSMTPIRAMRGCKTPYSEGQANSNRASVTGGYLFTFF